MVGRSTHWLTGLLSLAVVGLGAVVALELTGGVALAPEVTAAAPAAAAVEVALAPDEFQPPPQRQFNEISARPLFFPSRRPFVPPAAGGPQAPAVEDPAVAFELIGVVLTGRQRAALLQPLDQPAAGWVREQQTVAGWLVEEIAPDHVRLREGDRVETVELRADLAREAKKSKKRKRGLIARKPDRPQELDQPQEPDALDQADELDQLD